MTQTIIKRLFDSFGDLERAISSAKVTLSRKSNPPEAVLNRIGVYEDILQKQRTLATALCGFASLGDWTEVSRHVQLINGLSAMIRDDAREILAGVQYMPTSAPDEAMLS